MGDFCFILVLCMMSSLQDETSKYRNTNRNTRKIMRDPRGKAWPWLTVKRKCAVTATELNIKCVAKLSKFIISCTSEVFSVSFHPFRRPSKKWCLHVRWTWGRYVMWTFCIELLRLTIKVFYAYFMFDIIYSWLLLLLFLIRHWASVTKLEESAILVVG